ncbi:single-stranded DNA-binding protein [Basilea psittacipulmonis]|uniref:Single-stranded DNA-binding protein n=1 Tax=Basilea psittacipulmonis DSM 24701 TaxID=1072685 RepID=A0A077DE37_9BURK|nr:single-stranded DNA-binding protein [Basilea psittacipulmonis]AIL33115.1 hypothetical protein IX83_07205 [Basilea psittacipulmonis DSM 24701]
MSSVNKVILVGNLGRDPEHRVFPNSDGGVTNFSIATSYRTRGQDGNWNEETEWHNIVTFNRTAEVANQYLKKGSKVYVEGRIRTRKWQDKMGQDRYTTEVLAEKLVLLGGDKAPQSSNANTSGGWDNNPSNPTNNAYLNAKNGTRPVNNVSDMEDDYPF